MLEGVVLSAGVAAAVGAVGTLGVFALARRRAGVAAVLAPLVVVLAVAAGVYASVRAMFLSDKDSTTVLLLLAATVPVALAVGFVLAMRVWRMAAAAAASDAALERDREIEAGRREMVAWVSHDLRTPLAAVRVLAEALEDGVGDRADTVRRIQAENRRMSGMVDDLLALSRLQSPTLVLQREPVDLRDLVSDAVAATRPLADARGVRVTESATGNHSAERPDDGRRASARTDGDRTAARADRDATVASVDARETSRAIGNLLVNAVRHTPPGGTVTVTTRLSPAAVVASPPGPAPRAHASAEAGGSATRSLPRRTGYAVVAVQDECGGIPEEDLPRVFDAGWRATRARTPERGGSPGGAHAAPSESGGAGLGLAIARGVAEAHGGSATIRNAGRGCVAELLLPRE